MNTYELTILFAEDASEKEKIVKSVVDFVKKNKGELQKQDSWGVKTLAYPIKKHTKASYEFFLLALPPAAQPKLDKTLSLTEGMLRYLFVRI